MVSSEAIRRARHSREMKPRDELAEASALRNREKDLWQVATDKKYGQAIKTLGGLIAQTSAEMLEGDEGEDDELLL